MKRYIVLIVIVCIFIILCSSLYIIGFKYGKIIKKMSDSFTINGQDNITLEYGETYVDEGFNIDNEYIPYVKTTNNVDVNNVGNYEITYKLKYKTLSKTLKRKVTIIDKEAPSIQLIDCKEETYVELNEKVNNCDYVVSDNYDKDIKSKVKIDTDLDTSKAGDYKVNYIVTDSSNNKDTKSTIVHVRDKWDMTYIVVTISKQKLEYYKKNEKVLETPVTTGRNNATKTGNFKIRNKVQNTSLKGKNYVSYVKYWMAYDGNNYGIHDASWRNNFGNMNYKINGSHGCVNVPTKAMEKLYSMVEIGTPVYIKK